MRTILASAVLTLVTVATAAAQDDVAHADLIDEGQAIAEVNCGECHAVGLVDTSPHEQAPAFRTLSQNYPVTDLEEALAEGIVSGHPDMPEFTFEPEDVAALIAYLESVQLQ